MKEMFFDQETNSNLSVPLGPSSLRDHGAMQESEKDLVVKHKMLYIEMKCFDPVDIDKSNFHLAYDKMKSFNDAVINSWKEFLLF